MDWFWKGVVTMVSVALVLGLARRWGGSAAGLVAGLPTTTAPALTWMASEQGVHFASEAAVATVAACGLMAAFALAYAHATTARCGPRGALAWGLAAALAVAAPVLACGAHLYSAITLGLGGCIIALLTWPSARSPAPRQGSTGTGSGSAALPAVAAGGVSLGVGWAGSAVGTVCAGLLASLPVVSVTVAVAQHATHGAAAARLFLQGTVAGLVGRVAFGAVFAAAVPRVGGLLALALSLSAALVVHGVAAGWLARQARGPMTRRLRSSDTPPVAWGPVSRWDRIDGDTYRPRSARADARGQWH